MIRQLIRGTHGDEISRALQTIKVSKGVVAVQAFVTPTALSPMAIESLPRLLTKRYSCAVVGGIVDGLYYNVRTEAGILLNFHFDPTINSFYMPSTMGPKRVGRWPEQFSSLHHRHQNTSAGTWSSSVLNKLRMEHGDFETTSASDDRICDIEVLADSSCAQNGTLDRLYRNYPKSTIFGCVGSWTPFINSKPFTLFHNESVYESGLVGLVSSVKPRNQVAVCYPKPHVFSKNYVAERCQGNIVMQLEGTDLKPTDVLLDLLSTLSETKPDFYAILNGNQWSKISSGDPSNGFVALDSLANVSPGDQIQFVTVHEDGYMGEYPKEQSFYAYETNSALSETTTVEVSTTQVDQIGIISSSGLISQLPNASPHLNQVPHAHILVI